VLGLTRLAVVMLGDRPAAEDVVQDAFCGLYTHDQRAFDLFMATTRGLIAMQIANEPGGDRWARLVDEAVDILVAHYATSSAQRLTRRARTFRN
jgi:hypothetical protein